MSNFSQDMRVKAAYRMSLTEWNRLTESERREKREHVTSAPYFEDTK